MSNVKLKIDDNSRGAFTVMEGDEQLGEMVVSLSGQSLTVYHTEVAAKAEGKGLAKEMLATMVDYARERSLQVIPLCPFVHAQFKRHPEDYADIWNKEQETNS
jgi:uncharacterized protein